MKRGTRLLAALLCAAALLSLTAPGLAETPEEGVTADTLPFADVPAGADYAEAVAFCLERGIMNGVSGAEFQPNGTMDRAMLAVVLYRLAGSPQVTAANPFTDVEADSWYGPAVAWAAAEGIVQGYGGGLYGPHDPVSRQELAVFLWRFADIPLPRGKGPGYPDFSDVAPWAMEAVLWTGDYSVIPIRSGKFCPEESAVRSELAMALKGFLHALEEPEEDGEETDQTGTDSAPEQPEDPSRWDEFALTMGYVPRKGEVRPNSYDATLFVPDENGYMTYAGTADTSLGIDVSSHQGKIDWQQVAAAGVEFAMIRVGYRGYTMGSLNEDPYFEENIQGALSAGLKVGVYFFSQAVNLQEALEEARFLLERIRYYPITFPVVFDWERQEKRTSRTKDTSEETVLTCALAFCGAVERAGYTPMFYGSPSKAYDMELEYLAEYPFWLAHYTKDLAPTSYKYHFDIWQFTSKGKVPGVDGNVDINIAMRAF